MFRGQATITLWNEDGTIADVREISNIMCNQGLWVLANFLSSGTFVGSSINQQSFTVGGIFLALGTGTTTPTADDTELTTEHADGAFLARAPLTSTSFSPTTQSNTVIPSFSFYGALGFPPNAWTIKEGGVFLNGSTTINSGSLLDHFLVSPPVTQNVNQTVTIQVQFSLGS